MKKFLKSVHAVQQTLITNFIQKKEATRLSQVGGANTDEQDGITFSEYKQIIKDVAAHSREWKQFNTDSGKIVLEKNFFLNYIQNMNTLFMFRPANDQGVMSINTPDTFANVWENRLGGVEGFMVKDVFPLLVIGLVIAITFAYCDKHNISFNYYWHLLWIIYPLLILIRRKFRKNELTKIAQLRRQYTENPSLLLGTTPNFSLINDSQGYNFQLTIKYNRSQWENFYNATLKSMTVVAARLDGRISWLLYRGEDIWSPHWNLSFDERSGWDSSSRIMATIDLENSDPFVLMPVIETDQSFIFWLDSVTDDMDISDNSMLRHPIENPPVILNEKLFIKPQHC